MFWRIVVEKLDYNEYICNVIPKSQLDNIFTEPACSKLFDTYLVGNKNIAMKRKRAHRSEMKRKVVYFPYNRGFVLVPS